MNITVDLGYIPVGITCAAVFLNYMCLKFVTRSEKNMENLCKTIVELFKAIDKHTEEEDARTANTTTNS